MDFIIILILYSYMAVLFTIGILVMRHSINNRNKTIAQLIKIVQQAGGQNISVQESIRFVTIFTKRGPIYFNVSYIDINGEYQTRQVSKKIDVDDFYWDKPVQMPEPSVDGGRLESKEQIISDMDAEIKRLQEELARAKEET